MAKLRVRIYNVEFGDAIFLTIPEGRRTIKVLIDFGNALQKRGNDDALRSVAENLEQELAGKPLDLYIMTHEHMDHIQGPLLVSKTFQIEAHEVWMTASSAPDYGQRFPGAKKKKLAALAAYKAIADFVAKTAAPPRIQALLAINNPRSSQDCVDYISKMSRTKPLYIHRQASIAGRSPFAKTAVRLLAPEEDTSIYYGRLRPRTLGVFLDDAAAGALPASLTPPAGVAAGDFFDLVAFRASGMSANLRTIDKAANNTSVAFELEWRGWRLLFPGDAEEKSWELMDRTNGLRPVHFLKISHHGSKNGSPPHQIDKVFPEKPHDRKRRVSVVSTANDAYSGVPDDDTLEMLRKRSNEFIDTRDIPPGQWRDVTFEAKSDGPSPGS